MRLKKKAQGENVKVRNATPVEIDGIKFLSKLEGYTYEELKKAGIEAEYEPTRFTLIPAFVYNEEKVRPATYKPDFVGKDFIIECKGHITDAFPIRFKLFKYTLMLLDKHMKIYVVRNQKEVRAMIEQIKKDIEDEKNEC